MIVYLPDDIQETEGYLGHKFSLLEATADTLILELRQIKLSVRERALRWHWDRNKVFRFDKWFETKVRQKRDKTITENQEIAQKSETKVRQKRDTLSHLAEKESNPPNNINNNPLNKEKENNKEKLKKEIDFSIVSADMRPAVDAWLAYKKEKQQSYKPIGFKTFYKRLCNLSGNDAYVAMQIIEQSMASNYMGIFPLKQDNYANNRTTNTNGYNSPTSQAQQRENWLADRLSRKYAPLLADEVADTPRPAE